jgi:acyl-coenzyme A thioesterase PaaI-like protein
VTTEQDAPVERWIFGEPPLPEVVELAGALRDLTSTVVSLEHAPPELGELLATLRAAQQRLAAHAPADPTPRIGDDAAPDQRVYVDHGRDVGDFNPCFPQYELRVERDGSAEGTVDFPVCYEGPPGLVHGGFLAVFFDCVLQQINCDLGLAGKTAELTLRFRRPTPLLTPLAVHAQRTVDGDRIRSHAELRLGDKVLCECDMVAAVGNRGALPAVSPRRP